MSTEKTLPLQSRKFLAFLIAEATWKILAGLVLFWGKDSMQGNVFIVLLTIVVTAGFIEAFYLGGQAAVDKYSKLVEIVTKEGRSAVEVQARVDEIKKSGKKAKEDAPKS